MGELLVKFGKPHRILFLHKRTDPHGPTINKHEGRIQVLVVSSILVHQDMFCSMELRGPLGPSVLIGREGNETLERTGSILQ